VTVRLELICHAPTLATRRAAFAADEPVGEHATDDARRLAASPGFPDRARRAVVLRAPSRACAETAEALGLDAAAEPGLADWNLGAWRGRTLEEVRRENPEEVLAWLTDPSARPHRGESLEQLHERVGTWMESIIDRSGRVIAVTGPAVVRAAVVHVLSAPRQGFWRVDVDPLSTTRLTGRAPRWTLNLR
jgi:broad specificity phosphatase PhoE